ncbi:GM12167 [Drosophila sechellia]|uniref:GM12167 n=1 Tax=Drosophila sechellia TaxID=7238 RepID=B4HZN8_DROSE|nr:GM12167 [Drosophila sechellia]
MDMKVNTNGFKFGSRKTSLDTTRARVEPSNFDNLVMLSGGEFPVAGGATRRRDGRCDDKLVGQEVAAGYRRFYLNDPAGSSIIDGA